MLINPALKPEIDLLNGVGPPFNAATGEHYELSPEHVRAFAKLQINACDPAIASLLLVDEGDAVVDCRHAVAFYRGCGSIRRFPGGSHRFDHLPEALNDIRRLHDAYTI